jgi:hypothetical protein
MTLGERIIGGKRTKAGEYCSLTKLCKSKNIGTTLLTQASHLMLAILQRQGALMKQG